MPTKLPIRPRSPRSLVLSNTCMCSFDLEQTSLSFSTLAPLFSMFARCLVHESVAPTFRRGAGSLPGSWKDHGLAMPYRRSVRREDRRKKRAKREGGERGIWGCRRAVGKKFPDEFSRRSDLGRRILTPVSRRREKETDVKERRGIRRENERRERKAIKARAPKTPFFPAPLRPSDFGDQIRKPYYLNFFALLSLRLLPVLFTS